MNYIKGCAFGVMLMMASVSVSAIGNADSLALAADKAPANAGLNLQAGRALYHAGRNAKASEYLARGGNDGQPWLALVELEDYKFDEAAGRAEKYLASKHDVTLPEDALARDVVARAELARTMLDRVEKVIVIDSIVVDKRDFFKAYRISAPTGRLSDATGLPKGMDAAQPTVVYVSEDADRMLWGAPGADGKIRIVEASHLADGSWESPRSIGDNLQLGGNANFPFLLSDGMTLYYASDGEGSLGGYDIYVTRNDGDRYLNPQNVGMPYNSPMDDYLLAIDDATGVGWWATDRNLIPDAVTIYMFVPQELRDNYPVDGTDDLVDRARITSVAATHRSGENYRKYLDAVKSLSAAPALTVAGATFRFALPDGRVITSIDQLAEPAARELLSGYLDEKAAFDTRAVALRQMRARYGKGDKSFGERIAAEEAELEGLREQLRQLANDVIKAELR